jgi:hypothetical protein
MITPPLKPLIALVTAALCLGACSAPSKPPPPADPYGADEPVPAGRQLSEFGATIADWNATHNQDARAPGKAYNPGFVDYHNGDGPQDQFIDVFNDSTRIKRLTEQFPRHTDLAKAQLGVLAELPRDATIVWHMPPGTCLRELYSSRTLGAAIGLEDAQGLVFVEYKSGDPVSVVTSFDSTDITAATLSVGDGFLNPIDAPPC